MTFGFALTGLTLLAVLVACLVEIYRVDRIVEEVDRRRDGGDDDRAEAGDGSEESDDRADADGGSEGGDEREAEAAPSRDRGAS